MGVRTATEMFENLKFEPHHHDLRTSKRTRTPRSILGGVLVLVLLVIGVGGIYAFQQKRGPFADTPTTLSPAATLAPSIDRTADWLSYRNVLYGYALRYPPDWRVQECESVNASVVAFGPNGDLAQCDTGKANAPVTIGAEKESVPLGRHIQEALGGLMNASNTLVTIDTHAANRIQGTATQGGDTVIVVLLPYRDLLFRISYRGPSEGPEKDQFELMLSTFDLTR